MARPKSAIKLVSLKLFCNECHKEVSTVSVSSAQRDPRFAIDYRCVTFVHEIKNVA